MQVRHFDIWSKYNLRLPLGHHRTYSQKSSLMKREQGLGGTCSRAHTQKREPMC